MASSIYRRTPRLNLSHLVSKGGASHLVADDFFETSAVTYAGILRRWTGSAWVKAQLKTYLAGSWQDKPLYVWTGSTWGLVDTGG